MINQYMDMLVECLEKKNQILDNLTALNKKQTELIQNENFSLEEFDKCVDEKGILIDNILKLDLGFEGLYNKVGKTVADNPSAYKEQLSKMQKLITLLLLRPDLMRFFSRLNRLSIKALLRSSSA